MSKKATKSDAANAHLLKNQKYRTKTNKAKNIERVIEKGH